MSAIKTELLILQSTSFCNIDCKYCYLPNRSKPNKFDLKLLPLVLQNLWDSDLIGEKLRLLWHCGEPFTLPLSFFKEASSIIDNFCASHEVKIDQLIQTNATLLNQDTCDYILQNNISIGISVDGPGFINDYNRKNRNGSGSFEQVERGINLLKRNEIPFSVIAVVTEFALSYPQEIFQYFQNLGATYIGFNIDELGATGYSSSISPGKDMELKFKDFFSKLWNLNKQGGNKLKIREFTEMVLNIAGGDETLFDNTLVKPFNIITVNFDGAFGTFCPELMANNNGQFSLGNINSGRIIDSFKTEKFEKIFQSIEAGVNICKAECEYFSVCGGGNPSNKFYENKLLESSQTQHCRFTKQLIADVVLDNLEQSEALSSDLDAYYL